jgi:DMSO/TMAO reductase YedYZ molybdopterin-dependent catalytic subunit
MHVCVSGADAPFDSSVALSYAMDEKNEIVLAYAMNDRDIPRDHGRPLRLIVPGVERMKHRTGQG